MVKFEASLEAYACLNQVALVHRKFLALYLKSLAEKDNYWTDVATFST